MLEEVNIKFELAQPEFTRLNLLLEEKIDDLGDGIMKAKASFERTKEETWLHIIPILEADKSGIQKIINHLSAKEYVS